MAMNDAPRVAWLTSDELAALVKGAEPVVVMIPVGAIEPHGPHLPLDTDVIISRAAAARAVERLSVAGLRAFLAPEVSYGVTDCAAGFTGAAGVSAQALDDYLSAVIAGWLGNGIAHVCVVSNHLEPAHEQTLRGVVSRFPALRASAATPLARRWARTLSDEFKRGACHAGEYETSIVLAADPDAVRTTLAAQLPEVNVSLSEMLRAGKTRFTEMGLERAYAGAPARASAAHGREMIDRLGEMVAGEILEAMGRG
ncbi:MAG TPA: creatininase family protein [Candidatus Krumholzibacteria bacterium]